MSSVFSKETPDGIFSAQITPETNAITLLLSYPSTYDPVLAFAKKQLLLSAERLFPTLQLKEEIIFPKEESAGQTTQIVRYTFQPTDENLDLAFGEIPFRNANDHFVFVPTTSFTLTATASSSSSLSSLMQPPLPLADTPTNTWLQWKGQNIVNQPAILYLEQKRNTQIWKYRHPSLSLPILCVLLTLLILFFFPIKRKITTWLFAKRPLSPEEQAFEEIEEARQQFLQKKWGATQSLSFIADTLRKQMEQFYGIQALKKTTEEILLAIANHPSFTQSQREQLQIFLLQADRIKFAREKIPVKQWEKIFVTAQQIFKRNKIN